MSSPAHTATQAQLHEALAQARAVTRPLRHVSRAHARVSDILSALGRRREAIEELQSAAGLAPGLAEDYEALAFSAFGLGAHTLARECYGQVVELAPKDALAWYNLATAQRNVGQLDGALTSCNRALELDPRLVQAALLRSHLRTQRPEANYVEELRSRLKQLGHEAPARMFLNYALGKELDDLRDFDAAFHHFEQGAQTRRASLQYDVGDDVWKLQRIREVFSVSRLAKGPTPTSPAEHGVIIGLPRSGTTMIERVITGHPDAASNGETENLVSALLEGASPNGRDVFERVANADAHLVARSYDRRAAGLGPRLMLEKLPLNYLYAGAVSLTLPRARMVLVTRSAADNAFAMYSTLFGNGYPFSYDQKELAAYYLAYRELIAHWKAALGSSLLEIRYEEFVSAPGEHGPRIAAFLDLDWRDGMTKIEDNRTPSATASATQVRKPIYTSAMGRWRNYERRLQPLLDGLRAGGVDPDAALPADR